MISDLEGCAGFELIEKDASEDAPSQVCKDQQRTKGVYKGHYFDELAAFVMNFEPIEYAGHFYNLLLMALVSEHNRASPSQQEGSHTS